MNATAIEPIALTSLAEEAFVKLVQVITSGAYSPGQRLSESELARQLGISRGPLREALGRLEGRLVTRTPRIGIRVIDFRPEEVSQLFLVREALEGMAARLAADSMTAAEIDSLRAMLDQHGRQADISAGEAYHQGIGDDDFHFAIIKGARCEHLQRLLLDEVYYQLRLHRLRASTQPGRAQAAFGEHKEILGALVSRNPDAAEGCMRRHIRNARLNALSSLQGLAERSEAGQRRA
ncbi:GntR family transcriptional regulator [Enterovirga aerilata]|uniref:GntR family transcriptional regulator n=1 Tax=Enterovirga aerilata TaxID=2730920 RepID=A0A849I5H9_9HYPH|nr:GntR family transcriptional regulator [Enterovirga sp. DB1703]NNM75116.1 GntR family transcriptional regulator [Enterovirga sp. DB1703]